MAKLRKKDDSNLEFKRRQLRERTVAKRFLESIEGTRTKPHMGTGEPIGRTVHDRTVIYDANKKYNRDFNTSFYELGRATQQKNLKKARSEFEQEAGERRRQRTIGATARTSRQARFLTSEKNNSGKSTAKNTKRRER